MSDIDVWWQKGFFHITMAFVNETPPDEQEVISILQRHFQDFHAPTITFDKLVAFSISPEMNFVALTPTEIPKPFFELAQSIRKEICSIGGIILSEFKPHVTIARVKNDYISLAELQKHLQDVALPRITHTLTEVNYRIFRGEILFQQVLSLNDND